jgi:hypothetical protein
LTEQALAGGDVNLVVRIGDAAHRREMWGAGSGETILAGIRRLEENRGDHERWL